MEISVEATNELERKMTIAVPSGEVDSAVNARLAEAARTVRLNGFRRGKVPLKVVKSKFGKGVRQEVIGELMNQSYYEALTQKNIRPASQPRIETNEVNEGKDLEFTATFEVYPEIELPDFSTLKVEKLVAEVNDKNIDDMIETLREQRQVWEEVDREAATDDRVNIDYVGRRDGEEFKGGSAKGANLVLGSGRMIPGFEDGLLGKKAGDSVTLDLTFPENYHNKELAGQATQFDVTVNSVAEQVKPELNDEFFASFGVEEGGIESFRKEVAGNMEREMKAAARNKLKNKLLDALLKTCQVQVPPSLIAGEIRNLRSQALQRMGAGAGQNVDPSLLPDELFREQAVRRVTSGLLLGEVISSQNLEPDPARVRTAVEEVASTYESPQEVVNWYYSNEEQMSAVESSVLEDQAFDFVLEQATVTEKQVSYEDVIKAESPEQPEPSTEVEQQGKPEGDGDDKQEVDEAK
ncbi:MAG: trigger factor [Gammaproteobacteria bacterium]|nr:trigger factor [Pseudomonadales bacterium]MCP5346360.1 trigger factor [Pseudomonadales bacterium]